MLRRHLIAALALTSSLLALPAFAEQDKPTPTAKEILARSTPAEWRTPEPQNLLFMQLPTGRVVIELAPDFTPLHAANIRTLVRDHYFDGLAIIRVQDNFVTQWGDPNDDENGDKSRVRSLGKASKTLPPEFTRAIDPKLPWTALPDGDVYAPEVGFSEGFPVGRDPAGGREWVAHCYGTSTRNRSSASPSNRCDWRPTCRRKTARRSRCCAPTAPASPRWSRRNATAATRSIPGRPARSTCAASTCRCVRRSRRIDAFTPRRTFCSPASVTLPFLPMPETVTCR